MRPSPSPTSRGTSSTSCRSCRNKTINVKFAIHQRPGWWPPPLREGPPSSAAAFVKGPLRVP